MSMISDLADRLRVESKSMGKYGVDYMATLLMQASDTIIMLSEKARADRPQGEWIYKDDDVFAGEYTCSNCNRRAEVDLYGQWILSNYCPSCGARMKGADDD